MGGNYKSLLQQLAQRENGSTPTYQLLDEKGPDHSKCFKISAQIGALAISSRLGTQQERSRAARRPQCLSRDQRRAGAFSVRISAASGLPDFARPCEQNGTVPLYDRPIARARSSFQIPGRNNKLLVTTDTLDSAIAAAAATPGSRYPPKGTRMPAAIGISSMLYKKAQARFCLIVDSVATR